MGHQIEIKLTMEKISAKVSMPLSLLLLRAAKHLHTWQEVAVLWEGKSRTPSSSFDCMVKRGETYIHQKHSVPTKEHKGKSSLCHKVKICSRPHKGQLAPSIKFDEQTRISVVPVRPPTLAHRANNNFLFQNRNNNRIDGVASRLLAWINTRCLPYHLSLMLPREHTFTYICTRRNHQCIFKRPYSLHSL